jgi:hypothetical protein
MKRLVLISMGALALTGCVIHDHHRHPRPHAAKVAPRVVVPVVVESAAPAKHCPPGQAKKGKC